MLRLFMLGGKNSNGADIGLGRREERKGGRVEVELKLNY